MSYHEQIYGEITDLRLLLHIINDHITNNTKLSSKEYKFYDFGSGYGNIVSTYHNDFSECIGIEIVKNRYDYAVNKNKNKNVRFENNNFFNIKLESKFVLLHRPEFKMKQDN